MSHDDQAEFFIKQAGDQHSEARETDNPMLSLLSSIAHSLCGLNEKVKEIMEEEGIGTPGPARAIDSRASEDGISEVLIECTDGSLQWVRYMQRAARPARSRARS